MAHLRMGTPDALDGDLWRDKGGMGTEGYGRTWKKKWGWDVIGSTVAWGTWRKRRREWGLGYAKKSIKNPSEVLRREKDGIKSRR